MGQRYENHYIGEEKVELFYQEWREPPENGIVLITHGLAEHSECYDHVAKGINEMGWSVIGWDMRGHGRSEGKRGYVSDFHHYVEDLKTLVKKIRDDEKDKPLVLFGHSTGGLVTLLAALEVDPTWVKAYVLSSPALGFSIEVPYLKDKFARLANKYFPSITLHNEIQYEDLTHDTEFLEHYPKDHLRHDKISPRIYLGMLDGYDRVFANVDSYDKPILIQLAGHDKIVDALKSKEFYERLDTPEKRLEIYADSYHEVYNDLERETCIKHLKNFLGSLK